jgi:hypothetical protein
MQGTEQDGPTPALFRIPQGRKGSAQTQLSRVCSVNPVDECTPKDPCKLGTESSGEEVVDRFVVDPQGSVSALQRFAKKRGEEYTTQARVGRRERADDLEGRRWNTVDSLRAGGVQEAVLGSGGRLGHGEKRRGQVEEVDLVLAGGVNNAAEVDVGNTPTQGHWAQWDAACGDQLRGGRLRRDG